jgi:hypothetical protein
VDKEMENHDTVNLTVEFERGHTMIVAGATNNENGLERLIRGQKANMYMGSRNVVIRPESKFVWAFPFPCSPLCSPWAGLPAG